MADGSKLSTRVRRERNRSQQIEETVSMTDPTRETNHLPVFEHVKRRDWGLGILAWERQRTRGYLFENGQLRILAEEFYSFMREVDRPHDEVMALYDCLNRELAAARIEGGSTVQLPRNSTMMTLDDQIEVFRSEYPLGFLDPKWVRAQRVAGAKTRADSHGDSAIQHASERLGAPVLEAQIARQRFRAITDDALAVLRDTDLVPVVELKGLDITHAEHERPLALAIHELLHGESGFATRFERLSSTFEQAFRRVAGWQLLTALPALVHPHEHICIRPSSFREQAKWMAPRLAIPKTPTAQTYLRLQSMAKTIYNRLKDVGESPRDLLDVHEFIRLTTRPAAKKVRLGLKRAPRLATQ
jgi:hypothetical protein